MRAIQISTTIAAIAMLAIAGDANAQPKWVTLGCKTVAFNVDRDVVRVGHPEGKFRAIRLRVGGNDIHILDLKVVYGNGNPDDISVKANIAAGRTSGRLDLRGAARTINQVEMVYRTRPNFPGRAEVCVEGSPG